jgi:hypothetical protein
MSLFHISLSLSSNASLTTVNTVPLIEDPSPTANRLFFSGNAYDATSLIPTFGQNFHYNSPGPTYAFNNYYLSFSYYYYINFYYFSNSAYYFYYSNFYFYSSIFINDSLFN